MTYFLSALAGIVIIATWALVIALIVSAHHNGMERVRRAQRQWASDYDASRERHPSGRQS